jgi:hypothetical protein
VKIDPRNLIELTDAALAADYTRVRRAATSFARDLAKHGLLEEAKQMRAIVRKRGVPLRASGYVETLPVDAKSRLPLIEEQMWPDSPIFLNEGAAQTFQDFLADAEHIDALNAKGIASRLGLLLSGPPGTGKSLLAGHVAARLSRPFYVIRLDSLISSLLGDTAKNIRSVFDFVPNQNAVLFLDEMDAVAKLRDDRHELGELKRVVNTVIQSLDALDPSAIVIAATNHPQLLDKAIWRRFPYKIELDLPEETVRADLWKHFLFEGQDHDLSAELLAKISQGLSGADIETLAHTARRHTLLNGGDVDLATIAYAIVQTHLAHTPLPQRRALDSDQKKIVAVHLKLTFQLSGADIGRLLGVTRQAVYAYLKESGERDDG